MAQSTIDRLLLIGATGDLAGRYLLPALAALGDAGLLSERFRVVGGATHDWDDEAFRTHAAERLDEHAADVPAATREALVRALSYRPVDLFDPASVDRIVAEACAGDPVAVYLALPSALFAPAIGALGDAGLPPGSRIAVEKPFGNDLKSAIELNRLLSSACGDIGADAAYRVDHFLALASVQNLLGLRLANRVLEPAWNSAHVERVEIVWDETLALEGRAGYYDRAGALRDLLQNHLLQVLCLVAMEPPDTLAHGAVADRKLDVLRSVREIAPERMAARTRRARYGAGRIDGREVPAYVDEDGVDPARCTETFAEVTLELDSERWAGTRFVLRTAKAVRQDRMEIVVRFRPAHTQAAAAAGATANELRIGLVEPGELTLALTGSRAGPPPSPIALPLTGALPASRLPEYSRVLFDLLSADSALSVRGDVAEEAWRIMDPILEAWAAGRVPLQEYAAGSGGPPA